MVLLKDPIAIITPKQKKAESCLPTFSDVIPFGNPLTKQSIRCLFHRFESKYQSLTT